MPRRKILEACVLFCFLLPSSLLFISSSQVTMAAPPTITVPDTYASIQEAINAAQEGDTIMVRPGVYNENLVINKERLTLLGSGNSTVVEGGSFGHSVYIPRGTNNVTFAGFAVVGTHGAPWAGILIHGRYANITGNTVMNHFYGIYMWDSHGNLLRSNNMTKNRYNLKVWGLTLEQFTHDIDASNIVDNRRVCYWVSEHNKTVPWGVGYVALVNSTNIVVKGLNLSDNFSGVLLAYTKNSLVSSSVVSRNEEGIRLIHSHYNTVTRNRVLKNGQGVSLLASNHNTITGNNVSKNNGWGLDLELDSLSAPPAPSSGNFITGNTFGYNNEAVTIYSSSGNFFHHNSFVDNKVQVHLSYGSTSVVNEWNESYSSGGNYWSDYAGADLKSGPNQDQLGGDNIGDTPYTIDSTNQDKYPLITPCEPSINHDVAVVSVLPSAVEAYEGQLLNVEVIISNEGTQPETVSITCKYLASNVESVIGTRADVDIQANSYETVSFRWVLPGAAMYALKADVAELPGETYTVDNVGTGATMVRSRIMGDVDGNCRVDIRDISVIALAFGSYLGHPRWNASADLRQDNEVDIRDLAITAKNFGRTCV